jgi:eukaryotic-like serine/threonine-protein kinase
LEDSADVQALVLELVDGPTLADRIAQGPIPLDEALPLAQQIARALESAHDRGIIHRDLKPPNIKLRPDGTVKVLDFGLAKAWDPKGTGARVDDPTLTAPSGMVMGTPAYMSPEQARGQPVDTRADIWAFGCVVYEMLTGERPFGGADTSQTIASVIGLEPDWAKLPPALSPVLRKYLRACLRKDPTQRVRDMGDVRLALEGAFDVQPAIDESTRTHAPGPEPWRRTLTWMFGTIIVSVAVVVAMRWLPGARDDRPITFVVHAPQGSQFGRWTMAPLPALSHDGRHLAFVAQLDSRPVLWIQTLGDMRARALPGSDDALFPFWSPDADFVGFAAAGRLQKIAVSGDRAPQDVCICDAVFGGSWSAKGTIVFAGSAGLYRVSAGGGEPVMLTKVDQSLGEFSHRFPVLLPDNRRFLYLVRSTQDAHRGLYLGALDEPGLKRRLLPDDSNGSFGVGPDGDHYLFFIRDLELLAQRFDMSRGQLTGDAAVVAHQVIPGESGRFAPFAVAGRTLVYRRIDLSQTRLRWMDRRGVPGGTVGRAGEAYAYPSLSPDGKRLAVAKWDSRTGKRDIWLIDIGRGHHERLTADPVTAAFPLWTPNGDKVIFGSPRSGPWEIYSRSPDGVGGEESLLSTPNPEPGFPRDMTRDGKFLLLGSLRRLWVQPLDGQSPPYVLATASHARVSPDGRWVAYTGTERDERNVYVTTFPKPSNRWRISSDGGEDAQWRKDGKELYYVSTDQTLMAVPVPDAPGAHAFDGVIPQILFRASFDRYSLDFGSAYSPAPDGQRFIVLENLHNEPPLLNVAINWTSDGR